MRSARGLFGLRAVRESVPADLPVSVALGELTEWLDLEAIDVRPAAWSGIGFRKLGLAGAPHDWEKRWRELRRHLAASTGGEPQWVAVVYTDWEAARALRLTPSSPRVLRSTNARASCSTPGKSRCPGGIDSTYNRLLANVRDAGRLVALAGGLDVAAIAQLRPLEPDIVAVRRRRLPRRRPSGPDRHRSGRALGPCSRRALIPRRLNLAATHAKSDCSLDQARG